VNYEEEQKSLTCSVSTYTRANTFKAKGIVKYTRRNTGIDTSVEVAVRAGCSTTLFSSNCEEGVGGFFKLGSWCGDNESTDGKDGQSLESKVELHDRDFDNEACCLCGFVRLDRSVLN
jgi:hypothetical protein